MKPLQKIKVKCIGLNEYGQGIVRIGKEEIGVANLLPKEEALIELPPKNSSLKPRVLKRFKEVPNRKDPNCQIYDKCGGCQLLHLEYSHQIAWKKEHVVQCFKEAKIPFKLHKVIEATHKTQYRNKMQIAYRMQHNELVYGFYEEGTHRVIPLPDCLVQTKEQLAIAKTIQEIMKNMKIAPYDEDRRTGVLRFVMIKQGFHTGQVMVVLVINSEIFPGRNDFIKRLLQKHPEITTIVQNINPRKTSIILGDQERVLHGKGFIEDKLLECTFQIFSKSFFQINPEQTEKLYQIILEMGAFTKTEVVVDAYCGVGTIGICLSHQVKQVLAVENNKQAVQAAIRNAKDNQIKNVRFYLEDATVFLQNLAKEKASIDVIILDPPRSGSTEQFLKSMLRLQPKKIIYVSCEAATQARDMKHLIHEYSIVDSAIVDMFVGTYHVESILSLERK